MQGIPPFLSSVHFSGEAKVFYSPLPDSLLISSLFYCTARRNGEQNEKPFLSFLAETVSMSPSHCQQLHPFHIFLFCVSLVQRQLLYKHIDWAEPSSLKKNREECVRVPRFFFFFFSKIKNEELSPVSLTRWITKCSWRLKGERAESAGASAPRGHLGPFDSIQASPHLLTCP